MLNTFLITLGQVCKLFLFMALGFAFNKAKLYPKEFPTILSRLEVHVFMPALVFNTFSSNFRPDAISENLPYLTAGLVLLLASFGLAVVLARLFSKDRNTRDVYVYAFTIPNLGYLGYPLVEAVYGETALFRLMIFAIPFNIFIYTVGMVILNPKREFSIGKLLNPSMIAIVLGIVAGLLGFSLPSFLSEACTMASSCMAPCAMLLSGYVLASSRVSDLVGDPKMYIASVIRLIAIPAAAYAGLRLCGCRSELVLVASAMLAMPLGMNTVVFPQAMGGDSVTGARACFVSNLMGLVTIPLVFAFLSAVLAV